MNKDRINYSNSEQLTWAKELRRVFSAKKIKAVGFDLDDTLVNTRLIFNEKVSNACSYLLFGVGLQTLSEAQKEKVQSLRTNEFDSILKSLRKDFGIRPEIMDIATILLYRQVCNNEKLLEQAINEIHSIYISCPPLVDGANEVVDLINASGVETYLMTHAEMRWTNIKCDGVGIGHKFKNKVCFSVEQPKADQWKEKIKSIGYSPNEILVIGDNYYSDILPSLALGSHAVWVNNGNFPLVHTINTMDISQIDTSKLIEVKLLKDTIAALVSC